MNKKVCLYLEFYHFLGGILFKNLGTGLLSSYRNQKKILERLGVDYVEKWDDSCTLLQINTPWLYSLFIMKKAKRKGVPIIVWAHVTAEDIKGVFRLSWILSPVARKYLKHAYNQADVILCPSAYTRELVIAYGIKPEKVFVQSNGVDLKKFYSDGKKRNQGRESLVLIKQTVGTVALAIPRKGIGTFLFLAKHFPDMQFVWVGKIYSSILTKPLPKHIPHNARFTGFVPDILAAFNAFDIFIFPSYEENQGMVILEAAAIGLPIIVRDIPVYKDWLVHEENCLKAKTNEDFAECVHRLQSDEALRNKLAHNAKLLAQENSLEVLGEKFTRLYTNLLTKSRN